MVSGNRRGEQLESTLVVAGDISPMVWDVKYRHTLHFLKSLYKNVVAVMGNHEFYHSSLQVATDRFRAACHHTGVVGLCRDAAVVNGVQFVGTTLWSHPKATLQSRYCMNDRKYCPDLSLQKVRELHREDVEWLRDQDLEHSVVVTHHLPSYELANEMYSGEQFVELQSYFYSDQTDLLSRARMWICGHTHMPVESVVSGCYCVCNPLGYANERSDGPATRMYQLPAPRPRPRPT